MSYQFGTELKQVQDRINHFLANQFEEIDSYNAPLREKSAVDLSAISSVKILAKRLNADDVSYRHDRTLLAKAIDELIGELDYE